MKKNKLFLFYFLIPFLGFSQDTLHMPSDMARTVIRHVKYDNSILVNCCAGVAPNNNFASAIALVIGGPAINGFTCGGTIQAGESRDCNPSANQSVWYSFVATSATTYVIVDVTGTGTGCYVGSQIWQTNSLPTGSCHPLSCQSADFGPTKTVHQVTTITGTTYYVQILYGTGGICGTGGCFKISATNVNPTGVTNGPASNTCSTSNSTCVFNSPPTIAQITSSCTQYNISQGPNIVNSIWLNFTTSSASSTINMNGLITSNCGGGTIDWFDWTLYDGSCNIISCGTFPTLSVTGLSCSTTYNIQISWETGNCTWTNWYWYFNAPNAPPPCTALPVELTSFTGNYTGHHNHIEWSCASETNNNYFSLLRSLDAVHFTECSRITGAGNSIVPTYYHDDDLNFERGVYNYYLLNQVDFDGNPESFWIIAIDDRWATWPAIVKRIDLLGQEIKDENYSGFFIEIYSDGSVKKKCRME